MKPYYRAWHKELKTMLYPPLEIDSMPYCRDSKGDHVYITAKDPCKPEGPLVHPLTAHMTWDGRWYINGKYQDVEWMQWTGLEDKNKQKIFEGDIVECIADLHYIVSRDITYLRCIVVFEDGAFWAKPIDELEVYNETRLVRNFIDYWWDGEGDKDNIHEIEKLGNIYENHELLEIK